MSLIICLSGVCFYIVCFYTLLTYSLNTQYYLSSFVIVIFNSYVPTIHIATMTLTGAYTSQYYKQQNVIQTRDDTNKLYRQWLYWQCQ